MGSSATVKVEEDGATVIRAGIGDGLRSVTIWLDGPFPTVDKGAVTLDAPGAGARPREVAVLVDGPELRSALRALVGVWDQTDEATRVCDRFCERCQSTHDGTEAPDGSGWTCGGCGSVIEYERTGA